jgi:UDP-3-O-[3-hydroxymyristoyl] glucosamine N-acyltransferase
MTAGLTAAQLARAVQERSAGRLVAQLAGPVDVLIRSLAPLASAGPDELAFLANLRYRQQALHTRAAALVLAAADAQTLFGSTPPPTTLILCDEPYAWFALAAQELAPTAALAPGISPQAQVHPRAAIDPTARIDAFTTVEEAATIGAGVWLHAGCHVGAEARIGAQSMLYPRACVLHGCELGARVIVHSGAVIGADGFGFAALDGRWVKIPQTGRVVVGDDVEIGANTTIDRGTMGDTVIEDGVKIDNQVQVAHNCRIGAHSAIAGCVGIAGSAAIGRRCQIGGAAMIHGHISICDDAVISGGTLISRSIGEAGFYSGVFPFMPNRQWERNAAIVRHLDELRTRVRQLERLIGAGADPDRTT